MLDTVQPGRVQVSFLLREQSWKKGKLLQNDLDPVPPGRCWFLFSKPLLAPDRSGGRLFFIGFPFPAEGRVEEKGEGEDSLRALSALCSEGSARLEHRTGKIP